jgi:hypothetical protein
MYKRSSIKTMHLLDKLFSSILLATFAAACVTSAWAQAAPAGDPAKSVPQAAAPAEANARGNISSADLVPKILEDYTTPSLAGSDLKMLEVLRGNVDTMENAYTHEVTRVQWRPGDPIDLYIVKPAGVQNPPVILYLYSYPFENDRFLKHDFCKFLVSKGYAAVGFASALTAQRYHDVPMKEWFVSDLQETLSITAHDVQMILNYLASRGDMDMNRVGMFGDGSGASIAILAAAVDPRIKTLDLLDPWGDWPDWVAKSTRIPEKERPDYLKPEWLAKVAPLDPVKWMPKLKSQKIRIQFVRTVTITPSDVQQKIEAAAPANAKIVRYDDAQAFKAAIAGGTGFDWIKQEMQSGAAQDNKTAQVQPKAPNATKGSQ